MAAAQRAAAPRLTVALVWCFSTSGPVSHDGEVPASEVAQFGDHVSSVLGGVLGEELTGVYFVGSLALGGFVPAESDVDIVAVSRSALNRSQRREAASAIVETSRLCPARGVEFTLYRADVAGSLTGGAGFEVNANGGPRMPTVVHLNAATEPGFWYVLDRAIAHRYGIAISGPPPSTVFADVPRRTLLVALSESLAWHSAHEGVTLYSVLNACRAWRFAEDDVLGSKMEGAAWARARWPDTEVIDAAVALRHGQDATLDPSAVDALLAAVATRLRESA